MGHSPGKGILLIDGDLAVHADFRTILGVGEPRPRAEFPTILRDLEIDAVGQAEEGLALLKRSVCQGHPYLLAVVDLQGPSQHDGVRTVRRIWEEDPNLPLLLCLSRDCPTAARSEINRQLGRIDRFLFLAKPLDADEVCQAVAAQADRRLARVEMRNVAADLERALQRARERAEVAGRAKNEFMANISHEIRTPMNAILGFVGLLMKDPLTGDQKTKLQYVDEAGTALLRLIDNVLDHSKMMSGELELSLVPFHFGAIVREVLEATSPAAREKGLVLQYHVAEAIPRWMLGDKTRVRQILTNLVKNAIKFTEHGTIHVQAMLDEQSDAAATLRVMVTDTGVGILPERQAVMFESFSQADGSTTRQFGGLGLGLAICKQLVDLMGGQIGLRSTVDEGSSFWLTVTLKKHHSNAPVAEPPLGADGEPYGALPSAIPASGKPHILVAEDDPLSRTLAEMLLMRVGCLVDLAGDGREALDILKKRPYDAVLIDLDMPGMDALRAIEHIRHQETTTGRHVPIIVLTADVARGSREQCTAAGADEYLSKPFTPDALIETLQRFLPGCFEASDRQTPTPRSDLRHAPQRHLRTLCKALKEENFRELENSAAALKSLSIQTGSTAAADHAMRVQLAARNNDLEQAASAVGKLRMILQDRHALAGRS